MSNVKKGEQHANDVFVDAPVAMAETFPRMASFPVLPLFGLPSGKYSSHKNAGSNWLENLWKTEKDPRLHIDIVFVSTDYGKIV